MHALFYAALSLFLLPANYLVLKTSLNRSLEWPRKKVFELTLVIWAMTLVTCAILNESSLLVS